jgi:hypothetical protein
MNASTIRTTPTARAPWRTVAIPTEHGGWGLTAEPALLGLLVAPSGAGVLLAVAALVAFLARTPLKVILVARFRHRHDERTATARRVLAGEAAVLIALVVGIAMTAEPRWWWPAAVAAPLVALELWFDMRSRSRRLLPELAGAVGIGAVAAMIVLADGSDESLAVGVWLLLAARAVTSIPAVRAQIARVHHKVPARAPVLLGDLAALAGAAVAVAVDHDLLAGAIAVMGVVVTQRVMARRAIPPPKVIGLRQMALGLGVVLVTATGVWLG